MEDHVLRKLGATVLALPVLALVYLAVLGRQGVARVGAGVAAAVVVALVVLASLPPAQSNAVPAAAAPGPVDARMLGAVTTGHGLTQPFTIEFDSPMDPSSIAAALRLQPDAAVSFAWDAAGRVLTITPVEQWQPDTLYALTISDNARATDGGALTRELRSVVLTARAGTAALEATRDAGGRVRIDSSFLITLDRPATLAAVKAALRTDPPIEGELTVADTQDTFLFTPAANLAVNTTYRLSLGGLEGKDGVAFGELPVLGVRTAKAPEIVRFRPRVGAEDVGRRDAISVRFTEKMDKAKTEKAFHVSVGSKDLQGDIAWAEQGRVLVFVPAAPLPYGATVAARVDASAVSRTGAPVAKVTKATFTVEPKPKPKPKPKPAATKPAEKKPAATKRIAKPGGGAVKGNWSGVEAYYLRLMNCTRTGGWVTPSGSCSSPGGRDVAPLVMNTGISAKVARPYAKLLATRNICNHFIGGNPGDRLSRAGYRSYRWGENLGCRSGNPFSAVLGSHRYFQSEKPYNGGHYRNLMDGRFRQAGIGVWVSGGRVRLVVDFYTP